ncbi:MAG TPA: nitroreductase family protein [Jatrophihabitantaceae bacterium]|nr:nitroreductase family protein [Jatrophihabitantaceae bacterium]
MEFSDVVRRRRMVRAYDPTRPVARAVVNELLEHATHAPSAGFSQGWRFLVLQSDAEREAFWTATDPRGVPDPWLAGMRTAPVLVVVFSDKKVYLDRYAEPDKGWADRDESRWPVPYWHIDTGMAALLILLGAVDRGLAACFFGIPEEHWAALRKAFAVPERLTPIGAISLGYRAQDRRSPSLRRGRRPLSEVVAYGSF